MYHLLEFQAPNHQTLVSSSDWSDLGCYIFSSWSDLRFSLNRQSKQSQKTLIEGAKTFV